MLRGIFVEDRGPALPVELLIVAAHRGYRVEDVDIDYFERVGETALRRSTARCGRSGALPGRHGLGDW